MINFEQYFGLWANHPDVTPDIKANAGKLLVACERLEVIMVAHGIAFPTNPATGCNISGKTYGGFRPRTCPQGAPGSKHKIAWAVDRWDPLNHIDTWSMQHPNVLEECGIWIEHPDATPGWAHWQGVPPKSGRRVFLP